MNCFSCPSDARLNIGFVLQRTDVRGKSSKHSRRIHILNRRPGGKKFDVSVSSLRFHSRITSKQMLTAPTAPLFGILILYAHYIIQASDLFSTSPKRVSSLPSSKHSSITLYGNLTTSQRVITAKSVSFDGRSTLRRRAWMEVSMGTRITSMVMVRSSEIPQR